MRALLLLAFGGPSSLEEVELFLTRLFKGRKPSSEQMERVKERYRLVGGSSPLVGITQRQAEGLEKRLNGKGYRFKSYTGMRYSPPLIEETMEKILKDGIREVIAVPMAPFRSRESTGAYVEEVNRIQKEMRVRIVLSFVEGWHLHPLFFEAVREKVREGLNQFSLEGRKRAHLVFTAHSLPKRIMESDPYADDFKASVKGVLEGFEPLKWHMAFQSRGAGPEEWAGPEVESVLKELSEENVREVLIVPIGFVSDHVEILYDIDILYRQKAESLGMVLKRSPSLNASERFIEVLASAVEERMRMG